MSLVDGWIDATFAAGLRVHAVEFRRTAYLTNGWQKMRRWSGNWARRVDWSGTNEFQEVPYAGIEGPGEEPDSWAPVPTETASTGEGWEAGTHTFRWRWMDDSTGYVSNPSLAVAVTVAGADKRLTFAVAASGAANILRPTDLKVSHYVLEATVKNGSLYFLAGTFAVKDVTSAYVTSITADMSDAALLRSPLPWADDGHDPPPVKRWASVHRGRVWLYGDYVYSQGLAAPTFNSAEVYGSGTTWTEDALGTAAEPPIAGRRFFRCSTSEYYEIARRNTDSHLTLSTYFGASTSGYLAYEIVSGNGRIYFSREDEPESFPPDNWIGLPTGQGGGNVTAGVGFDQGMLFFTRRGAYRVNWVEDPGVDVGIYPVPGVRGALSPRVVATVDGRVYALDDQGVWLYDGNMAVDVSRRVSSVMASLDFAYADRWHAVYLPDARAIRFYVTRSGDTRPGYYLQVDTTPGPDPRWTDGYLDVGCSESHLGIISQTASLYPLTGDANGHCWRIDTTQAEGAGSTHHMVVGNGSSPTQVVVTATLPTDGSLRGAYLSWRRPGGTYSSAVISSHSSTAFNLASALSGTPAAADLVWVGRIPSKLKSAAFYSNRLANKMRTQWLHVYYQPTSSARYLQVRIYDNLSSTARSASTFGTTAAATLLPGVTHPGTNTLYPATDWLLDLSTTDGLLSIPLSLSDVWCFEVELECVEPDTALTIYRLAIDHHEDPSVAE